VPFLILASGSTTCTPTEEDALSVFIIVVVFIDLLGGVDLVDN